MKVLIITYDFPYPINSGGKARIYNLIKFSQTKNLEIILYSFVRNSFKDSYRKELENIGVSKIFTHKRRKKKNLYVLFKTSLGRNSIFKNLYFSKLAERQLLEIIDEEKIDVILFESFYTSFFISNKIKKKGTVQIFGTENIENMLYFDFAKTKPKILKKIYMNQVEKIRQEEEKAYDNSDHILAVTSEEKDYISKKSKTQIEIIPNGVDTKYFSYHPKKTKGKELLFVGNFSYFPNIDAMDFFYKNVFLNIPDATLTVVGKFQNRLPFLISDMRVKNIEYIKEIRNVYYNSDIFIFPVRFGGGTNFKVLEAAACGTPIVAMPERVEGLDFKSEKNFISATTATEFMAGIRRITDEKGLGEKIAKNARELVEEKYDWQSIGYNLQKLFLRYDKK